MNYRTEASSFSFLFIAELLLCLYKARTLRPAVLLRCHLLIRSWLPIPPSHPLFESLNFWNLSATDHRPGQHQHHQWVSLSTHHKRISCQAESSLPLPSGLPSKEASLNWLWLQTGLSTTPNLIAAFFSTPSPSRRQLLSDSEADYRAVTHSFTCWFSSSWSGIPNWEER